jgi:putative oxidoreductase
MRILQLILNFIGRLFLSVLFILSAVNKILDWQNTERGLVALLCDWNGYVKIALLKSTLTSLMSWVPLILVIITALELIGGLLILFGIKTRLGAFLLILFFVPVTILFHHFWFLDGQAKEIQYLMFLKNIAVLGGLFLVLAHGSKTKDKNKNLIEDEPSYVQPSTTGFDEEPEDEL